LSVGHKRENEILIVMTITFFANGLTLIFYGIIQMFIPCLRQVGLRGKNQIFFMFYGMDIYALTGNLIFKRSTFHNVSTSKKDLTRNNTLNSNAHGTLFFCYFAGMLIIPSDFDIRPGYFMRQSELHGTLHTYRVMCYVLLLGKKMNLEHQTLLAFCAAFVHDMARRHDGFCMKHGPRSAREKIPFFIPLFERYGLDDEDINVIKTAVSNHSQWFDLSKRHPHYLVAAILKDADALDRVRLGHGNLKVRFLRLAVAPGLISFSHRLYEASRQRDELTFAEIIAIAEDIAGETLVAR